MDTPQDILTGMWLLVCMWWIASRVCLVDTPQDIFYLRSPKSFVLHKIIPFKVKEKFKDLSSELTSSTFKKCTS